MKSIERVAVVGGTHGNELSGIYLLKKWEEQLSIITRPSFSTETVLANPKGLAENKRYIDCDLNRQFTAALLADNSLANYEQSRAKAINYQLGPKGSESATDFIIDLHNTTSNMGPTLILLESDVFNRQLAAYVLQKMPDAVVVVEDESTMEQHYFLASIGHKGVIVEIGPQPQGVIRQDVLEWMEDMTTHILDFIEMHNTGETPDLPAEFTAYRYHETLKLPENAAGERIGMVHRNVQDNDFKPLRAGDPIFKLFNGEEIFWEGDYEAYPHFINEAAYYDNNLAMSLAKKVTVTTR